MRLFRHIGPSRSRPHPHPLHHPRESEVAQIFLTGFLTKLLIFSLELREKRRLLCTEWKSASPEETSGVINRALFIWINHIFLKGFRTILSIDTLTLLDEEILSASNPTKLVSRWAEGTITILAFASTDLD